MRNERRGGYGLQGRPGASSGARRVLSICPETSEIALTHAVMSEARFRRLDGSLSFWCPKCRSPHEAERDLLWLEGARPVAGAVLAPPFLLPREAAYTPAPWSGPGLMAAANDQPRTDRKVV